MTKKSHPPKGKRRTPRSVAAECLPRLDQSSVLAFVKRIAGLIDLTDYGWLNADNEKRRYTTERIDEHFYALKERKEAAEARRKGETKPLFAMPLRSLSQSDIVEHVAGKSTFYYVSDYKSGFLLAGFDFDWKDHHKAEHGDANDSLACAKFVLAVLGIPSESAYIEPSTGGDGVHVYVLFSIKGYTKKAVNDACARLSVLLSARCKSEGYLCGFDGIMGTFSLKDGTRGQIVKIPRPDSDARLASFLAIKPLPFKVLGSPAALSKIGMDVTDYDLLLEQPSGDYYKGRKGGDTNSPNHDGDQPQILEEDAFVRTVKLCDRMNVERNRAVGGSELLAEYNRLFSESAGPETRQRVRRCHQVAKERARTFRPNKPKKNHGQSIAQTIVELTVKGVEALIPTNWTSKTSTLKVEDIALVLYLLRAAKDKDGMAALPKNYFISASRKLRAEGQVDRNLDNKRIAVAKRILAQEGFISVTRKGNNFVGTTRFKVAEAGQTLPLDSGANAEVAG